MTSSCSVLQNRRDAERMNNNASVARETIATQHKGSRRIGNTHVYISIMKSRNVEEEISFAFFLQQRLHGTVERAAQSINTIKSKGGTKHLGIEEKSKVFATETEELIKKG